MLNDAIQPLEPRRLFADTLAMYTYAGDMNFDGLVDAQDYGVIDNFVQFPGTSGWYNGDFNYDGVIDAADYGIIDNTIQLQGNPFPGTWIGGGVTAVNPTVAQFSGSAKRDVIVVTAGASGSGVDVTVNGKTTNTTSTKLKISGNGGNDKIHIDLGDAYANLLITIFGGDGDDAIVGGTSAERIIAGEGNDFVLGNGGRDTVYAEGGDDSVRGGGSSDLLDGGAGNDTVRGDGGHDRINGGDGFDRLRGSVGNDTIDGGASKDFIGGEVGRDRLTGGGGADVLSGGEDTDVVDGGAGNDHCYGDGGNDLLTGGSGVDSLFGGEGFDECIRDDDIFEQRDRDAEDNVIPPNGDGGSLHSDGSVTVTGGTITGGGKLDLTNNKLITDAPLGSYIGGAYTGVQGEIARAYDFGAWDQPGLITSMPTDDPLEGVNTIGVATGEQILSISPTDTGIFAGQTVTGASTLVMYTYAGDMNFDGLVDAADYGIIDTNVPLAGANGYANGDLNYDGVIDAGDYAIIDNMVGIDSNPD